MPQEMLSGPFGAIISIPHSLTLHADHAVKDLHSDCTETVSPADGEVKSAVCKFCIMTFIPPPAPTGSCQPCILERL